MSSAPGIGTAYSVNATESLIFCAGEHKPDSKRNCLMYILLTRDVLLSLALQSPCAEVFGFAYTALGVKRNLLVQALLDAASDSQ